MSKPHATSRFHVIVVLNDDAPWAEICLASVLAQTLRPWKVTLFDNTASSAVAERVAERFPQARLMRSPVSLGVAGGFNRAAVSEPDADYLLLLDPAAVPALQAMERMSEIFDYSHEIGILGCRVLDRDVETIRNVGVTLSENGLPLEIGRGEPDRGQYSGVREVPCVQGAAIAVRQMLWSALGGFDERFHPTGFEGIDLCCRAREAGWRVAVDCDTIVTHFDPWTMRRTDRAGLEVFFRNRARFLFKHTHGRDWLRRYLPAELRWVRDLESAGMRAVALKNMLRLFLHRDRAGF
jgi:GT2 family glycosyltransferase